MEINVNEKRIGKGAPVFIVAEIGTNHNGDVNMALEMVDSAKEIGVDAVKFQPVNPEASYIEGTEAFEIYKKVRLKTEDWQRIKKRAEEKDLVFFAAPADLPGVEQMKQIGLPLIKISSPSMTNIPLQNAVAELGVPVMVSTGMSYIGEVEKVVLNLKQQGVEEIILLHCVSLYPSPMASLNLRAIGLMKEVFPYPIGYSDHSVGNTACIAAVALGAVVLEKHFTLDKNLEGPEHRFSADYCDMERLVQEIRDVEQALGFREKRPSEYEIDKRQAFRRCLVANRDIPKGTTITEEMVGLKRPLGPRGLETDFYYDLIGMKAARDIKRDATIKFQDI